MGKTKLNLVYFDIDRMIREYSLHCGIKSGEEALSNLDLKQRSNVMVKSIELLIEESIKDINTNIENTIDPSYSDLILQIETTWNKSFVINCIPNIEFGNYVNIPVEMVLEDNNDEIASFIDDEDYFFSLLNRIPLTVNKIRISELMFYNIVNSTIVPLFLDLNKKYVLIKD